MDLSDAHLQTEAFDEDRGISQFQCQVGEQKNRFAGTQRPEQAHDGIFRDDDFVAGGFP